MQIKAAEISQIIKDQIGAYETSVDLNETGTVISVGDGIARVYGVQNCMAMELLEFPGGIMGLALNLEADNVGCAVLGNVSNIKEGDIVKRTGRIAEVPVGPAMAGRVVDGIGAARSMDLARSILNLPQKSRSSPQVLLPEKVFMSPAIPVQRRLMP